MIDQIRISNRVQGRRVADTLIALIGESLMELNKDAQEAAAENIVEYIAGKWLPPKPTARQAPLLTPMTDAEAREFEKQRIPFGKHMGAMVENVSWDYLAHLTDPSDFIRKVKRYLKNENVQREMEDDS